MYKLKALNNIWDMKIIYTNLFSKAWRLALGHDLHKGLIHSAIYFIILALFPVTCLVCTFVWAICLVRERLLE